MFSSNIEFKNFSIKKNIFKLRMLKKLKSTENKSIFLDNDDPSEFNFFWISLFKFYLKKYIFLRKQKSNQLMNRDKINSINDIRGIVDNPEAAIKIANNGLIDNIQI